MDRENRESMDDIHLRILRVTEDLRVIQRELNCAAMQAPTDPELMEALADPPEMESIQVLKSALDQMRHFLWFYMQVVTSDSEMGEKFRQTLRHDRVRCATWPTASSASPTRTLGARVARTLSTANQFPCNAIPCSIIASFTPAPGDCPQPETALPRGRVF